MRGYVHADTQHGFSEYLAQCNKTGKEVRHHKEEIDHRFLAFVCLVKSTRYKKTVE